MAGKSKPKPLNVYLYIPNIIGYLRILMNCVAFAVCFVDKKLFSLLYFVSFVCDALDGWCARKFNQLPKGWFIGQLAICIQELLSTPLLPFSFTIYTSLKASTFGAVLDMVTDRVSTACLLVILSQVYRPGLVFLSLLALDISSHWLQMYSTFLVGKTSHKDVKDSSSWLFRLYYGNRMFMGYCCVSCEVLYITLFLLARKETDSLIDVLVNTTTTSWIYLVLLALLLFGWAIKQFVNVIQMKTAADACVLYDINKKQ